MAGNRPRADYGRALGAPPFTRVTEKTRLTLEMPRFDPWARRRRIRDLRFQCERSIESSSRAEKGTCTMPMTIRGSIDWAGPGLQLSPSTDLGSADPLT